MCIHWETLVGLLRTKNLVSSHPEDVEDLVGKLSDPSYLAKKNLWGTFEAEIHVIKQEASTNKKFVG